ncbi:hypothetical protein G9A89_004137 [Geosiphon pyriformis]|nr:hypothetical protein G9A89_004137 [Geosiphon pyriformis]
MNGRTLRAKGNPSENSEGKSVEKRTVGQEKGKEERRDQVNGLTSLNSGGVTVCLYNERLSADNIKKPQTDSRLVGS